MTFRGFCILVTVCVSRLESTMINLMVYVLVDEDVVGALCEQHQHVEVPVTFFMFRVCPGSCPGSPRCAGVLTYM